MTTVTRYIGTCPVCEGEYRLHRERMVHHGYRRPGHGSIVGDCPGVDYPPYEVSTEGTEAYRSGVLNSIKQTSTALERFKSGEVQELSKLLNPYGRHEPPQFKKLTPADGWEFRDELKHRIRENERHLAQLEAERDRCDRLIRAWVRRPIRTLEESQEREAQAKAERSAMRDLARREREAKLAAKRAKVDEREARYQQFLSKYREEFETLARDPQANKAAALAVWKRMFRDSKKAASSSKRFLNSFVSRDLKAEKALFDLGLAKIRGDYMEFADEFGWIRP